MVIIFLSVSSKSDLMLSQFALSYLRIIKNKLYFKMKKDKKYKEKYKRLKHQVQKEQRHAYNTYIEKLILDLRCQVVFGCQVL
jgi:hypothetical protein